VFWRRCHPASAVAAIVAAPVFSVLVEWMYGFYASRYPQLAEWFGMQLNFMHRVFVVFVLCLLLQVLMSLWYGRRTGYAASEADLVPDVRSIRRGAITILVIHLFLFLVMEGAGMPARPLALPAALLTGEVFLRRLFLRRAGFAEWLGSERLYASMLAGATVWILYYFA
jgi:hypothetical protein